MQERSLLWQAIGALVISLIVLGVVGGTVWFIHRVDVTLLGSSPPLPSGVQPLNAYILTIIVGLTTVVSGAVILVGIRQAKYFTRQFAWVVYVIVAAPLALVLLSRSLVSRPRRVGCSPRASPRACAPASCFRRPRVGTARASLYGYSAARVPARR